MRKVMFLLVAAAVLAGVVLSRLTYGADGGLPAAKNTSKWQYATLFSNYTILRTEKPKALKEIGFVQGSVKTAGETMEEFSKNLTGKPLTTYVEVFNVLGNDGWEMILKEKEEKSDRSSETTNESWTFKRRIE